MDDADRASEVEQAILEARIAAARGIRPTRTLAPEICDGCGDAIPEVRRKLVPATRLCADCANEAETLRARGLI